MTASLHPHSIEAEQGVLGCCIIDPACIDIATELDPGAFYDLRHEAIWQALQALRAGDGRVDTITLFQRLKDDGSAESVGGVAYLGQIQDHVPSAAMLPEYLAIVRAKHDLRRLGASFATATAKITNEIEPAESIAATVEAEIAKLGEKKTSIITAADACRSFANWAEARHASRGKLSGIETGFYDIDRLLDGLQFGESTVVAARPSVGKTQLALDIIRHNLTAAKTGNRVLFVTAEMSPMSLVRRLAGGMSGVPLADIRAGSMSERQIVSLTTAVATIAKLPIDFLDAGGMRASVVAAKIRTAANAGARFVVVDYLQKIVADGRQEKRTYEVGEVSGTLTRAARKSGVALLLIAQLNRESEKDKGRLPRLTDLADSGQIERDADTVILLHRDKSKDPHDATAIIAKQRDGDTGLVRLRFNGELCRFENAARVADADIPEDYKKPYND